MPGHCYSCGTEFGVFKKEHGCKNCGFAFCSKCLHSKTIPVPRKNNTKHHVCVKCYKVLTGEVKNDVPATQYELPQAYIKRMEALKEREAQQSVPGEKSGGQTVPSHLRNLAKPDRDIAMRLENLKQSDKPKVTNDDIKARLSNLQGQPHQPDQKPVYQPPDRRLQGQQVDDLLDEIAAEIELDSRAPDPVKDIEARLKQLHHTPGAEGQGVGKEPYGNNLNKQSTSNSEKSEMYNKNIGNLGHDSNDDSNVEEIHRLMAKAASELEVDAQKAISDMHKDKELMERLTEIQKRKKDKEDNEACAGDSDFEEQSDYDSEEDEEKAAKRIIQKYLEESKIDEKIANSQVRSSDGEKSNTRPEIQPPNIKPPTLKDLTDDDYEDPSELPYCSICTEDATIRCRDCDMDLFCRRCFRECHQEMEITDHRTMPFKAPKGY